MQADKPIAELKLITPGRQLRPFGLCAAEFTVPDDFDPPLPEEVLNVFEGRRKFCWILTSSCGLSVEMSGYQCIIEMQLAPNL